MINPMLAKESSAVDDLITNDDWIAERKYDGIRCLIIVTGDDIRARSRNDTPLALPVRLAGLLLRTQLPGGTWVLDGELVGKDFVLFDIPIASGARLGTLKERLLLVDEISARLALGHPTRAELTRSKIALLKDAIDLNWEGVVFKNLASSYTEGRSGDWVKFKLTSTADLVVTEVSTTRLSCNLGALVDGAITNVCAATVKPGIKVGQIVEVEYLSGTANSRLTQPRILRQRPDKTVKDVTAWNEIRILRKDA